MLSEFYFDNAATTIISPEALKSYSECALEYMGNPSANHREGQRAHEKLEEERRLFASKLKIKPEQLFFTSGATESIQIVLSSLLWAKSPGEVIISKIEHEAVSSWSGILKEKGWVVKTLKAKGGFVSPEELEESITEKTRLVAIMMVNNVTGAIQDIDTLVKVTRRKEKEFGRKIFFFSDCVQALGKIPFSLTSLDIDGACFSSHKIAGARGIGALFLKKGEIQTLAKAGGQEKGVRGGTENLPSIAAFTSAYLSCPEDMSDIEEIYNETRKIFQENGIKILSPETNTSPFILSITTPLPSEVLTRMLIDKGWCVSSGSACSNNAKGKGEGILQAMGFSAKDSRGAIRISFFHYSSLSRAKELAEEIIKIVREF